jgi:hypothetical protein
MNIKDVTSHEGDADLQAQFWILDAVDVAADADVSATSIILTSLGGGIGFPLNDLEINTSNRPGFFGTLTASSMLGDIYIIEKSGDLGLNTISAGLAQTAYITNPNGRILNRVEDPDDSNAASGKLWLFATLDIGEIDTPITTEAGNIEARSTLGSVIIDNSGAVEVGGVVTGSFNG